MRPNPFVHDRDSGRRFFAFDMFGTLAVNTAGTILPIFEKMCTYYPGVPPEDLGYEYSRMKREFTATHKNRELPVEDLIRRLDERFGFHNNPEEMEDPMLRGTHLYGPAPGAMDALMYLRDNGYRIGVLSNTRYHSRTLTAMLEDYGFMEFIDKVVTSADLGYRKPEPCVYEAVCKSLGTDLKHCFYCGDNVSKDYYGPLAAGMKGAALIDPEGTEHVRFRIGSIGDLPALFGGNRR